MRCWTCHTPLMPQRGVELHGGISIEQFVCQTCGRTWYGGHRPRLPVTSNAPVAQFPVSTKPNAAASDAHDPLGGNAKVMEQRKFQRFSDQSLVRFSNDKIQGEGHLGNLSLGGAAVVSSAAVERGSYLTLTITFSGQGGSIEVELAPVRWIKEGSFGVEFIRMSPEAQRLLKQYVDGLEKPSEAA